MVFGFCGINGRKTQRYQYTVTEPNNSSSNQEEKYLTVGKRTSEEIDSYLMEGHNTLNSKVWLRQGYTLHVTPA